MFRSETRVQSPLNNSSLTYRGYCHLQLVAQIMQFTHLRKLNNSEMNSQTSVTQTLGVSSLHKSMMSNSHIQSQHPSIVPGLETSDTYSTKRDFNVQFQWWQVLKFWTFKCQSDHDWLPFSTLSASPPAIFWAASPLSPVRLHVTIVQNKFFYNYVELSSSKESLGVVSHPFSLSLGMYVQRTS